MTDIALSVGATYFSESTGDDLSLMSFKDLGRASKVIVGKESTIILKNERGYGIGYFVTTIFAQIILAILASTIVCWYSRRREFYADYGGAQLTSKESMIASLRALERYSSAKLPDQMLAFV